MEDLNNSFFRVYWLLIPIYLFASCKPSNTEDKRYINSISYIEFEDIDLSRMDTICVKKFSLNKADTNKYVLLRIQIDNKFHFSSKVKNHKWYSSPGYRGPSDFIKEIKIDDRNKMFVPQSDSIFRKPICINSNGDPQIFYSLEKLISEYKKSNIENKPFFPLDNFYLVVYKDSVKNILNKNSTYSILTNRKIITRRIRVD